MCHLKVQADGAWQHALAVTRPALVLGPATFLTDLQDRFRTNGVRDAVRRHDTGPIFGWLMGLVGLQGISDRAAFGFVARHEPVTWKSVSEALNAGPSCHHLRSHWHFEGCGFRKAARNCAEPLLLLSCPLPSLPLRKGSLNQAAFALALFIRDVCDGDLVNWIDQRLAQADPGLEVPDRAARMRTAVLKPLCEVHGVGPKLWSMMLADLLLGGDPDREQWVTTGASMIAIDSLIHNFLHRTGVMQRFDADHPYGPACYGPEGCASVIEGLAERIDAHDFSPAFPAVFPRFVQASIWSFCAEGGYGICNGNRIDDRNRCGQRYCPAFRICDREPLYKNTVPDDLRGT